MLHGVLDRYRRNGVPPALVDAEKQRAIAQAEFKANSISNLGQQWSEAVAVQGLSSPDDILNGLPIVVFDLLTEGNISRAVRGEKIGTLVCQEPVEGSP